MAKPGTTTSNLGKYAVITEGDTNDARISLCGGKAAGTGNDNKSTEQNVFRDFVRETLKDGNHNWPTSTRKADKSAGPTPVTNDNATAVATDLTKLTSEEKTIVAGLLAKTIEGGEVVEIRAVSSTSSMVNFGSIGRSGWVINQNLDYIIDEREQASDSFSIKLLKIFFVKKHATYSFNLFFTYTHANNALYRTNIRLI
ncbi:putative p44-74 outer membrane protein, silent [Anaplasma phagocytophilum str. NCH-1]|uniref:Putative p44-74 outer membrane protein, silent n=1 Tax=Anaplasma phagocytophilum str. NCH-1 TaxID=1359161 RepID=A0A0F3N518_ANAPH|nr:putative p44-74 outer membrane protein, silent [Anaplasma phagocytophilum str. Webster]KJV62831.1 putative p44-74 outer membrane protein, silent [Anaplasma phagocytophilum str. NCH-1]KJV87084.1 putative p44-74 outer membrane protein, silent [Anaplasma phagocytophilum str. ApNYW]